MSSDDFIRLIFLHDHREVSSLTNELPEESDQFRFLPLSRFIRSRRPTPFLATSLVPFPPCSA